jgi:hypothetical protein
VIISPERLQEALNKDGEFRFHSRRRDSALQLQFGEKVHVLTLKGGEVLGIDVKPLAGPKATEASISAPEDDWAQLDFYPAYRRAREQRHWRPPFGLLRRRYPCRDQPP